MELKNIELLEGQIYGIIGESGSGKTTLLNNISSNVIPTINKLNIKKSNINNVNNRTGYVKQNLDDSFFNKTVYKEIEFYIDKYNYKVKQKNKRIEDVMLMVGLDINYLYEDPQNLSSSEKFLLSLACCLVYNPSLILIDEIRLDNSGKTNLIKLIRKLKIRYKKTIIIATSDANFLHKIVDYVYVLHNNKIVLKGDKYTVFANRKINKYNIKPPKEIEFSNLVYDMKNIKIGYRDDINDLIKDIYRFVK